MTVNTFGDRPEKYKSTPLATRACCGQAEEPLWSQALFSQGGDSYPHLLEDMKQPVAGALSVSQAWCWLYCIREDERSPQYQVFLLELNTSRRDRLQTGCSCAEDKSLYGSQLWGVWLAEKLSY